VLRRIAFIVFAQRVGLTLGEIGTELEKLPPDRAPTRRDWARLSSTWSARIDERLAELQRLKIGLTECIGAAACRSSAASSPTRATAPRAWAPGRGIGSGTGRRGRSPAPDLGGLYRTRKVRAADHAPGVPPADVARTRHQRSPVAVNEAATCEAVTPVRSRTVVVNALEELACSV
jgi:hypothetical protein